MQNNQNQNQNQVDPKAVEAEASAAKVKEEEEVAKAKEEEEAAAAAKVKEEEEAAAAAKAKEEEEAAAAAEAKEEEEAAAAITTVDAAEVENYGVYNGVHLVKTFNLNTHGENFKELAENFAKRKGEGYTVKEYIIPGEEPEYSKDSVVVYSRNKQVVRVYSLETHGKDYKKLAKQFVDKYAEKKGYQF